MCGQLRWNLMRFPAKFLLPWLSKFLHMLHDDLLQEHLPQGHTRSSVVDVLGLPCLESLSMLTQPPRKRLPQRETVLRSTVNSPQTSLKAPWISVGFFFFLVSSFDLNVWPLIWNSRSTRHLQAPFLVLVKQIWSILLIQWIHVLLSQVFNCNWSNFH